MKRRYAWNPDLPDYRDHAYEPTFGRLPERVDLRALCSPVEDQGNLGSCTANAIAGAIEFLENKEKSRTFFDVSRLFVYYQERVTEGTVHHDAGAMIRDGIKACHQVGYCTEVLWPYTISKFAVRPPKNAYADAAGRKITEYLRVKGLNGMLARLAEGFPVVFGFTVYDAFESAAVAQTGVLNLPAKGEKAIGGHAVLAVGFDDPAKRIIVRNSWGTGWGDKGYFTMPFEYVANANLCDDFWTVRK